VPLKTNEKLGTCFPHRMVFDWQCDLEQMRRRDDLVVMGSSDFKSYPYDSYTRGKGIWPKQGNPVIGETVWLEYCS